MLCLCSYRDNYVRKLQRQEEMRRVREEIERQQEEEYVRKETDQGMCLFAGAATTLYVSYLREKQH